MVERHLYALKRKFSRDLSLKEKYTWQMNSMLDKGYAEKAPEKTGQQTWYIPHHATASQT